jgi:hypothetical protein
MQEKKKSAQKREWSKQWLVKRASLSKALLEQLKLYSGRLA